MDEHTLQTYSPAYGDRVAVHAFCSSKQSSAAAVEVLYALTELRSKWKSNRQKGNRPGFKPGIFKPGHLSADRTAKRVELGWMNFNEKSMDFKQVRQTGGGGVRHLTINKTLVVQTLLEHAKETCFPPGNSKHGSVEEFDMEIKNFQGIPIDKEMNINDLYIASKLKILSVYMYTKKKTEKVLIEVIMIQFAYTEVIENTWLMLGWKTFIR
ncbi:hypothetical protein DPMN_188927 [Dreissena polymorpha]|uniref:Uncharacterized protein n=1 Tax=Dreissena polymorpha TaxID=45954 RepID=A0A9D4DR14_DREPO|nr:hypothetical protein DPMN_188927 [Dreissena polymorpha]